MEATLYVLYISAFKTVAHQGDASEFSYWIADGGKPHFEDTIEGTVDGIPVVFTSGSFAYPLL